MTEVSLFTSKHSNSPIKERRDKDAEIHLIFCHIFYLSFPTLSLLIFSSLLFTPFQACLTSIKAYLPASELSSDKYAFQKGNILQRKNNLYRYRSNYTENYVQHSHARTYVFSKYRRCVCSYRIYKYINPYSRTWHTPHRIWPQQRHGKKLILTQSNANNLWKYYRKRDQSAPRAPRPLGLSPRSLVGSPRTPLGLPQATLEGTWL